MSKVLSPFLAPGGPAVQAGYKWATYAPDAAEDDLPLGLFADPGQATALARVCDGCTVGRLDNPAAVRVPSRQVS